MNALESEYRKAGRGVWFEQLHPFVQGQAAGPDYSESAARLGASEGAIRIAVHRLRKRYRELLRWVVAQTVADPMEIDGEVSYLIEVLAR